jgi:hypothetical protein
MISVKGSMIRLLVLFMGLALLISFKPSMQKPDGEDLARQYCTSCHVFPDPKLLDKKTWKESVLPNMGWRLGVTQDGKHPLEDMDPDEALRVRKLQVYPSAPLINVSDWRSGNIISRRPLTIPCRKHR